MVKVCGNRAGEGDERDKETRGTRGTRGTPWRQGDKETKRQFFLPIPPSPHLPLPPCSR
ncbi:MAG: hypothetical protein KME31_25500 [Tolypothrix carrinoi HA7290-LM1]|nr:hypothetical protein [Tolypothrix carrinoi HA7290-LM1]